MANLYQKYCDEIRPKLQQDLEIKNPMAVPKISKITINMGVGEAISDRKIMDAAVSDMTAICLLYTSPSPRDQRGARMPSSA